jgi:hypothetical protein
MRFFLAAAAYFYRVMGFDLAYCKRLPVDQPDYRPQEQIRADNEGGPECTRDELSRPGKCSDHRRTPERCRRVEALDIEAFAEDHSGAEKADPGNDLGGDPGRTVIAREHDRENDEPGGPDRHQGIRPEPGHALPPLSLNADQRAEKQGRSEADSDLVRVHGVSRVPGFRGSLRAGGGTGDKDSSLTTSQSGITGREQKAA